MVDIIIIIVWIRAFLAILEFKVLFLIFYLVSFVTFLTSLLRHNFHTQNFSYLKYTIQ